MAKMDGRTRLRDGLEAAIAKWLVDMGLEADSDRVYVEMEREASLRGWYAHVRVFVADAELASSKLAD